MEARDRQQVCCSCLREGVVDVGVDPFASAKKQCRGERGGPSIEPFRQTFLAPKSDLAEGGCEPSIQRERRTSRFGGGPDANGVADRESKPDALRSEKVAVVEFTRIEWTGDRRKISGGLDQVSRQDVGAVTRDDDEHSARARLFAVGVVSALGL